MKGWGLQEAVSPDCSCSDGVSPECHVHGKQAFSEVQAHLEQVDPRQRSLNVAMTGSVGSDALGGFYRTKLLRANVHFLSEPISDGTTGTVMVLTTPDAQRTMLAYMVRAQFGKCFSQLARVMSLFQTACDFIWRVVLDAALFNFIRRIP